MALSMAPSIIPPPTQAVIIPWAVPRPLSWTQREAFLITITGIASAARPKRREVTVRLTKPSDIPRRAPKTPARKQAIVRTRLEPKRSARKPAVRMLKMPATEPKPQTAPICTISR